MATPPPSKKAKYQCWLGVWPPPVFHFRKLATMEYGSTLYVGLARAVSPTNTNFRLTFLLTRLQEALYEDLAK